MMGLARQLAGSLQEQLQQATNREIRQAGEARKAQEEATARELRLQQEALERERRQFAEASQLQVEATARELRIAEEARKAQEAAYSMELERARQTDRSEDRLFVQFRDSMDRTRTDLTEAALLRERAALLELELKHAREAAAAAVAAAAERTQPTEVAPPRVSKYCVPNSEATGTQPPISRKLAKKMRYFFASTIAESDVEQDTAATTAGVTSDTAASSANVAIVEQPLIEPIVSVAPLASAHTHVYESADAIDEPVWVLRTTESSATASTSTSYVAHSTILPQTALSAVQS